jgi:cell division protein ZapA
MADKTTSATIEILGKFYPIRCLESELSSLQAAAEYLNRQMLEVQKSHALLTADRIAIITALNVAHQFLEAEQQKNRYIYQVNQRISELQSRLDHTINQGLETELIYTAE